MPANLCDMERTGNGVDERTLQLAFELSMLGLDHISSATMTSAVGDDNLDVTLSNHVGFASSIIEEARNKKSQNMTECVPVPSSEHVAEIVGRQGEFHYYYFKYQFNSFCFSVLSVSSVSPPPPHSPPFSQQRHLLHQQPPLSPPNEYFFFF